MKAEKMYAMAEAPCCEEKEVHADKVQYVNENMPSEDDLYDLAESRNMTQSAISHQLRLLKQAGLVNGRREGKQIIYYLADEHVRTIIAMGLEHINE